MVYAIVKSGGRQEKVTVGDVVLMDRLQEKVGETVELEPIMVVDGDTVTTDSKKLDGITVKAEVIDDEAKGPKIRIVKYKNKTGYKKRQGHRQRYTQVKVTGIEA